MSEDRTAPIDRPEPDRRRDLTPEQEQTMEQSTGPRAGTYDDQEPWSVATGEQPSATGSTAAAPADEDASGVRVGTVVWGLVIAAVGVGLLALAAGLVFDVQLAVIALVALAGVGLVVGSLISAARRRGRR